MKKLPALFVRDHNHPSGEAPYLPQLTPGCSWVLEGEGRATRKFDGTAVRILNGQVWKRYDAKGGKAPPPEFEPCEPEPDPITTHWPGWLPVRGETRDNWQLCIAIAKLEAQGPLYDRDGTYELCGPSVQGNPEGFSGHVLVRHGVIDYPDCPRHFHALRDWLSVRDIEGIVFHHQDGRMVKVTKQGFGLRRVPQ